MHLAAWYSVVVVFVCAYFCLFAIERIKLEEFAFNMNLFGGILKTLCCLGSVFSETRIRNSG